MKKLIFIASCLFIVLSTNSQTTIKDNTTAFTPYWTLGANGGINWFFGENNFPINPTAAFTVNQNIGYLGRLNVTRQISPVVGIRGMLGINKYNYFNNTVTPFYAEHLTADIVFNLTNQKKGYNPDRFFHFLVFGGLGAGYLNNNSTSFMLDGMLRGGLQGDFKLSTALHLNLIAEMNILTDNANHTGLAGKPIDLGPALTLGFTYRLGKVVKRAIAEEPVEKPAIVEPAVVEPVTPPTVMEPEKPMIAQDTIKPEIKTVTPEPEKPLVAETTVPDKLNEHIFFTINQRQIQSTAQKESMQLIADFIAAHPDSKVVISGYADRGTGTVEVNNTLSKQRAVLVANTLIREYGVPLKNIWVRWFGSGVQPYAKANQNRLVIVRGAATFKEAFAIPNIMEKTVTNVETSAPATTTSVSSSTEAPKAPKAPEAAMFEVLHFAEAVIEITDQKQKDEIKKVADYLNRNPSTMVTVNGYGDNDKDGEKKSIEISKSRAQAVADILTKTYSISPERILVRWYGAQKESSTNPTMNKMVIINTTK